MGGGVGGGGGGDPTPHSRVRARGVVVVAAAAVAAAVAVACHGSHGHAAWWLQWGRGGVVRDDAPPTRARTARCPQPPTRTATDAHGRRCVRRSHRTLSGLGGTHSALPLRAGDGRGGWVQGRQDGATRCKPQPPPAAARASLRAPCLAHRKPARGARVTHAAACDCLSASRAWAGSSRRHLAAPLATSRAPAPPPAGTRCCRSCHCCRGCGGTASQISRQGEFMLKYPLVTCKNVWCKLGESSF
jgi:hypothetical protein